MGQIKPTPYNVMKMLTTAINPITEYEGKHINTDPNDAVCAVYEEFSICLNTIMEKDRDIALKIDDIVARLDSWNREIAHEEGIRFGMAIMMSAFMG